MQDEYIYVSMRKQGAGPDSPEYARASFLIFIAGITYLSLMLLEMITLSIGLSVMFKKINSAQVLLHGLGVLGAVWMLLNRWHWIQLYVMAFAFGLIPFLLEVSVIFAAKKWYVTISHIASLQSTEAERQKAILEQRAAQKALMNQQQSANQAIAGQ